MLVDILKEEYPAKPKHVQMLFQVQVQLLVILIKQVVYSMAQIV